MQNKLLQAIKMCKRGFYLAGLFSAIVNLLMLTIPLYMLQLFDRVLVGQSADTLIYLTIIAVIAILVLGLLDMMRGRVLSRNSEWLERKISIPALLKSSDTLLAGSDYGLTCIKDIGIVKAFLSSPGIYAFFDLPWTVIFVIVVFLFSPVLGVLTIIGGALLAVIGIVNVHISNKKMSEANKEMVKNQQYIDNSLRNSEVIEAMGMLPGIIKKWYKRNEKVLSSQGKSSDTTAMLVSLSKFIRMTMQILVLGIGAFFVIKGELTPGAMIASSIVVARALAPIEQVIGSWRQALSAHEAYQRLTKYFNLPEHRESTVELPTVEGVLTVENVFFIAKNKKVILRGINFELQPGEMLAVVGHSGAGKSTLGRLILGVWEPSRGEIRLDGASVYHWDREHFGENVGYLPQNTSLLSGTVKDNICRMGVADDQKIINAATYVGSHSMIQHLTEEYDTDVEGYHLSGGQARRIALARAFYNDPQLVVLDEPEMNLDHEGLRHVAETLHKAKKDKKTIIMISQNQELIKIADKILVLHEGNQKNFGINTLSDHEQK